MNDLPDYSCFYSTTLPGEEIESNAVSVYVHQLRRKLGADAIRTVRGAGYAVDPGAKPDPAA